jgi:two-component system chemotaxis response regulator CheB
MSNARVLIVDDSLTMRALFSGVLERARGIDVVGMAANADEARELMIRLKPDVVTLDVEMPGMSGLDFLEEIMRERPTPVVMLSTLTQKGAETSFRALELGAVDCFPKPKSATPDEFNALAPKLAALVIAASTGGVKQVKVARPVASVAHFDWNGKIIALSASVGGVDAMLQLLPTFPKNCPPTIVLLQIEQGFVDPLVSRLKASCPAGVVLAEDGLAPNPLPLEGVTAKVRTPSGRMPVYSPAVLRDTEIADIVAYLQSIPKGTDAKDIPLLNR